MEGKQMKSEMDSIVTEERPWSELPREILLLIARYIDQKEDLVRTFAVCKPWKSVTPFIHRHKKGTDPLLLSFPGIVGGQLYNHLSQKTCFISVPELNETVCGCSNDGWLLLGSFDESISNCEATRVPQFFIFNPFTTDRIDLPERYQLISQDYLYCFIYQQLLSNTCAFSSPSDPNWTFFALKSSSKYEVIICTYHSGDRDWTTTVYPVEDEDHHFIQTRTNVVSHKGVFYCLGKFGKLGAFDSINHTWTVTSPKVGKRFTDLVKKYFVESNGELFVVDDHRMRVNVFWLDKTKMEWVRVKSLGDRTLYVGSVGSVMVTPSNPSMKNRIYFPERVQKGNQDICENSLAANERDINCALHQPLMSHQ
ncbi:hypothetical protein H6P81_016664 [Aristolochia fimbriata]|uniref:F-box domain-containing protein n=1 Tax=Aristolochia fimbriata TaxID=158543 RepID=A0AAV7E9D1_ARIFI|nr:hypothetical protein H6P81_016664 [Aristolochia fimbriata]